ncbi:class I SAM-dependent methyltransferase [candidate division TA06 bacterium]|uniref:Class I SAM-dependent methyltransferase n=1 Tax=candidate division TA06 bacterium TaxID=2250710 RepID=A0A523UVD1_UNCT6|nr:MAG: class I SAM-dependent methyltransferase [candidate division TA06 bacterium]
MGDNKRNVESDPAGSDTIAHKIYLGDLLRQQITPSALDALTLPTGSQGLDAGCGIGSHLLPLAEAVGSEGRVTGLDISPEFLARARETVENSNLLDRISLQEGNVNNLPFNDNTFDWAWSSDCVGYPVGAPQSSLKELTRVVKPGGTVAILGWSSQQVLPGYPVLEARLNARASCVIPYVKGERAEYNFLRALGWFRDAGFEETTVETFVGDVQAPLSDELRSALLMVFDMLWGELQTELTPEDRKEYQRLCLAESPDLILNLPDYYAFLTYTMFHGKVPG